MARITYPTKRKKRYPESITFYNEHELGNVKSVFHLPNREEKINTSFPKAIKIKSQKETFYELETGIFDSDFKFHPCPISFFYFILEKISIVYDDNIKSNLEFTCHSKIFTKDYSDFREFEFTFTERIGRPLWATGKIIKAINAVNLFVDSGRKIENLQQIFIFGIKDLGIDRTVILKTISNLKFEFIENSAYAMGRDNYFWREAIIENLPSNNYLLDLIIKCLKLRYNYHNKENVQLKEDKIIIKYDEHRGFSLSHGKINKIDQKELDKIVDHLKIDMSTSYNELQCLLGKMEIKKKTAANNGYNGNTP